MKRKLFLKNAVGLFSASAVLLACKKTSVETVSNSGDCAVAPTEEEGPYPYPGGEVTNPLQRTDVTGGQAGHPLALTLKIINSNNACNAVENARVDIWYCNKDGYYSGYGGQPGLLGTKSYVGETWLRGYQFSDASGLLTFTGIYPGWYGGRATHIHYEVFINGALKKIGQLAFPEAISDAVHRSTLYAEHGINTTRNATDHVFGNSPADLANETLTITGDLTAGYTGTHTIGLPL